MALNEETGTRKLAAIMFTDIKSFSKKMGENEVAAMQILRVHDGMMTDVVKKYGGIVIKSIGDSFMVDFSSAVNAVKCAIEVQETFWAYNKGKPEFEKIEVRVGVHLGDVITVGNDIFGDGVNIAARIEAITEPSRICISGDVYNQIKNKMGVKVYSIGSIELKNIAEPVEVFEILIDTIPELAEPSESARQLPSRKKAEAISKQEEEEARKVEETKKKVTDERQKEEQERQGRADEIFKRAEEYFQAGDLESAENELKEIYKIVTIHYGAQMLLLQIEEERARRDEEERRKRVKEEKKRKEEDRLRKIQERLNQALEHVAKDQFTEALAAVHEVYTIDPKNSEAKRLEEQIKQAEQAKAELDRLQALEAEQRAREEELQRQRETEEAVRKARAAIDQPRVQAEQKKSKIPLYAGIAGGALVAIVLVMYLLLPGAMTSGQATVAVLTFESNTSQNQDTYLGVAVATMIAEQLARSPELTIISPTSATRVESRNGNGGEAAKTFGLTNIVVGTIQETDIGISVTVKLIQVEDQQTVWESSLDGSLLGLHELAGKIAGSVVTALKLEPPPSTEQRFTSNAQAFDFYLRGLQLVNQPERSSVEDGITYLRLALQNDSTFAQAHAALGKGLLEQFKYSGEVSDNLLNEAFNSCRTAVSFNPNVPLAYTVFAQVYRYKQRYQDAREMLSKALTLQPGSAECTRQLALLSIFEGDYETAAQQVASVLKTDPKFPETYIVSGLLHHFKREYEQAVQDYDTATKLGADDSLLTVWYKFSAWTSVDMEPKIVAFCIPFLQSSDDRMKVVLHYWIGRAYQFEGKLDESLASLDNGIIAADRVLTQNPNDAATHALLALLQSRRGRFDVAQKEMEIAESLAPNSPTLSYWKARMFAVQNNKNDALANLAKAIAAQYNISEILDADFLSLAAEAEFTSTITRKTGGAGPSQ